MPEPALAGVRVEPGRYRHFKGGEYEVLRVGKHTETDELVVVYCPIHDPATVWVRPLDAFVSEVERPDGIFPRFERIPEPPLRRSGVAWLLLDALYARLDEVVARRARVRPASPAARGASAHRGGLAADRAD